MSPAPIVRTVEVRHLQLVRAAFAAIAAALITFSPDHSASIGLSVFSGFATTTGMVFLLAAWLVYPSGRRWPAVSLGVIAILAGTIGGIVPLRTTTMFFGLVVVWAVFTGVIEAVAGGRALRAAEPTVPRSQSRDALTVGVITVGLGVAVMFVPAGFALSYYIQDAHQSFTLTGITIAVGIFGAYAAVVAVYLAIAGFSPGRSGVDAAPAEPAVSERTEGPA